MFQFLIGSLEAKFIPIKKYEVISFQFLIGSLEASLLVTEIVFLSLFQFLIGSLEACHCQWAGLCARYVSIPHR